MFSCIWPWSQGGRGRFVHRRLPSSTTAFLRTACGRGAKTRTRTQARRTQKTKTLSLKHPHYTAVVEGK